jgi:hypothetical protein
VEVINYDSCSHVLEHIFTLLIFHVREFGQMSLLGKKNQRFPIISMRSPYTYDQVISNDVS